MVEVSKICMDCFDSCLFTYPLVFNLSKRVEN